MAVNYFLSTVGSDVEVFNNYATFRQATADNTSPIPGYLFGEVNAITHENNGSNCKALVSYFISRLQCHSPLVKIKVLKLLIHLARNGHRNVVEQLRIYEVPLKEAASSSGSPSDLHGPAFHENVRKLAKELLHLVFSEESAHDIPHQAGLHVMCGLGSEASCKKFTGFGNRAFKQKTLSERVSEHVSHAVERILSPNEEKEYYKRQAGILGESLPHYNPVSISKTEESVSTLVSSQFSKSKPPSRHVRKVHVVGKPGGGWDDTDEENETDNDRMCSRESGDHSLSEDSLESKIDLLPSSEWPEEHKIVNEFVVNEPLEMLRCSEIESVCKKSSELNCDKICEFLVEKLSLKEMDGVKMRCLVLLEYFLHYDVISLESVINIALPLLQQLSECRENSLQIKSKKLCLIVGSLNQQQRNTKTRDLLVLPLLPSEACLGNN